MSSPLDLLGTPRDVLPDALAARGIDPARAGRVFGRVHRGGSLATDPQLGPRLAARLDDAWWASAAVIRRHPSADGTHRLLLRLHDGAEIEAVLVAMAADRTTLCLSTQVGCAMGCTFCATGTLGLTRHLAAGEIVAQVATAREEAAALGRSVDRIVFMGMGEPLHNLQATIDAVRVLTDGGGPGIGGSRITVSTVGLVDRLAPFAEAVGPKVGLALSLHAGTDAVRQQIVPLARRVSLASLRAAMTAAPALRRRTWMAEYVLLPGVNDTEAEADGVAAFVDGLKVAVNLLPFNPFVEAPFRAPDDADLDRFSRHLRDRGVYVTVRRPRGRDVDGACGQLARRAARA